MADNQFRGIEGQDCPAIRVTQNAGCPSIRVRITGGGETPEAPLSDVNFYDYDGKRVASYTAADFAALTEMPANPSHQGLTAQGWNWSLADAQAYVATYGILDIGQQYITDDGKSRLYIRIAEPVRMTQTLYWQQTVANGVTIDWGDGSAEETTAGTGNQNLAHTYATPGDYIITMEVTSGAASFGNGGNITVFGLGNNENFVYTRRLVKAEIGEKMALPNYAFNGASLESISMPQGVGLSAYCFNSCALLFAVVPSGASSVGALCFSGCSSLRGVSFPKSVTLMDNYIFNSCVTLRRIALPPAITEIKATTFNGTSSLSSVIIPNGVTSIGASAFVGCYALSRIIIPSTVTSIDSLAFSNCYGMKEYHFKSTTPPTIAANTFNNIPADCVIYAPASAVAAYQGSTNWSTYASQIVGE